MLPLIINRIGYALIIIAGIAFVVSAMTKLVPGDPVDVMAAGNPGMTEADKARLRSQLGLDRSMMDQYVSYLGNALQGDLGESYKDGFPVSGKLVKGLRYTAILALTSMALALVVALPLSILTALKKDTLLDDITRLFSFIGNSLPNFLISVLLMYFLCVRAHLLPLVANESIKGLLMPCLALSIPICGRFIRQFRAEFLEQLGKPYVSGAMLRGVKRRYVLKNVLHNSSISILTIVGLSIGTLFGGSVVIETIFRWPGLGKLAMDAITNRDYPVIQGFVLFTSTVYVVINLLIDICYSWVDPRLRKMEGDS